MGATLVDLKCWVEELMKEMRITNYKLDLSGTSSKGDGYLGEVNFIKVVASSNKGDNKIYNLVVKSAKKSDELRKKTPIQEAFDREMFVYKKILPIFVEFQKEYKLEVPFGKFAKCYSVCREDKKEALILKNLKSIGFEIHDRTAPQNLNHVLYVFQNYGKYHGVSLAMKIKKPALFNSLTKNLTDILGKFIIQSKMLQGLLKDFENAVKSLEKNGKELVATKFKDFNEHIENALTNLTNPNDKLSVILHGDCWNNNMMFKYEKGNNSQPIDMCFIDFQLSRLASPILDLSYYLYTCADRTVLRNFDFLLQAYYSSLTDFLNGFGIFCENLFTFRELKDQWKIYGKFGLAMAPFIIKIELCKTNEVVDFAESAEKDELEEAFDIQIEDQDEYERRIGDVLEHFAETFL